MASLAEGWRIQVRVIGALMIREITTRFGRQNIGFLWIMGEPLLFAGLVGMAWRLMRGPVEHGIGVVAFCISGYLPFVLYRHAVSRSQGLFRANANLMYHRQIKILDFVFVRFLIEFVGHLMAYLFIGVLLWLFDAFPVPHSMGFLILGWFYYSFFALSVSFLLAPLSEMSELLEKFLPVTTYLMIPLSGVFFMVSWLTPSIRDALLYSPPIHGMEMMRYGLFGDNVTPHFEFFYPIAFSLVLLTIGLALCRRVRKTLVVA